ncbi:MAG: hypothetical protein C4293_03670 [Nitrospiraceae bacterium]
MPPANQFLLILSFLGLLVGGCYSTPLPSEPTQIVPSLLKLLTDSSPDVRRTAALSLGKIGAPEAIPALRQALSDPDSLVRQYSAWALGNLGEQARDQAGLVLVGLLRDPSPTVTSTAAEAIGAIGATESMVEFLVDSLQQGPVHTRHAAVKALALLEAPSSYPALVQALADPDAMVRQGAIAALGELSDRRAVPLIIDRLLHDPDSGVRSEAAYRLGILGDQRARSVLESVKVSDPNSIVKRWAGWAIEQLTSPGAPGSRT